MKIVCLGDSLTYGYGIQPYDEKKAWPALLAEMENVRVINAGVPGISLLSDGGYWNSQIYLRAMRKRPDALILWIGNNDSSVENWNEAAFEKGYALMVEELLEHVTRDHLLLIEPLYPCTEHADDVYDFGIRKAPLKIITKIIRSSADLYGTACMDLNPSFKDQPQLFTDDVHPSEEGNRIIAERILQKIHELGWIQSQDRMKV